MDNGPSALFKLRSLELNQIQLKLSKQGLSNNSGSTLRIEIESLNPIAPSKIGMGSDDRPLSVGLISATFE